MRVEERATLVLKNIDSFLMASADMLILVLYSPELIFKNFLLKKIQIFKIMANKFC